MPGGLTNKDIHYKFQREKSEEKSGDDQPESEQ